MRKNLARRFSRIAPPRKLPLTLLLMLAALGAWPETGTMRIGADIDYPPYSFIASDGEPAGFDIDVLRLLAKRLDLRPEFELMPWSEVLPALEAGEIDLAASTLFTISRSRRFLFSTPYNSDSISIFTRPGSSIDSIVDLDGRRMAILDGDALPEAFIESNGLHLKTTTYPTFSEALRAVNSGAAEFSLAPYAVGMEIRKRGRLQRITVAGPTISTVQYRLALNSQAGELRDQLDREIAAVLETREYRRIHRRWLEFERGGTDIRALLRGLGPYIVPGLMILLGIWIITLRLQVRRQTSELRRHSRELAALATEDQLTGLANRRLFETLAETEFRRSRRRDVPLAFLYLDIDHFKSVNDNYGHAAGDTILRLLAERCGGALREYDTLARLGGEEFAVLLPDTDGAEARKIAERICGLCREKPFEFLPGSDTGLTVSIGVAASEERDTDFRETLARADRRLYRAKRNGRDQIVSDGE